MSRFVPQIRSQHPTHSHLRRSLTSQPFRAVIRLGSTTATADCYPEKTSQQLAKVVEINSVESIKNSANKLRMKTCFTRDNIRTAEWLSGAGTTIRELTNWTTSRFPIVAKHIYGSRGTGNTKIDDARALELWTRGKNLPDYIFEKFYNFSREYRLHVTKDGCFYTNRKLRRNGTPDNQRWFFNDSNSNWILETNPLFDRPSNWDAIVTECVNALRSTGLDIGGFDVKVQSRVDSRNRTRQTPDFIIIESNSACSHGDVTAVKYREELNRLLNERSRNYIQGIEETISRGAKISSRKNNTVRKLIRK